MASSDDTVLQKADFGQIYDQSDPRAYYTTLAEFDYQIPQHGADIVDRLLRDHRENGGAEPPTVLDVCCSYGIVTTLLNTDLSMEDLSRHYTDAGTADLSEDVRVTRDAEMLRSHRRADPVRTIGIDVAGNAVNYALSVGALDHGAIENLEEDEPSPELAELLAGVDLITTTGGVGYVTGTTFDRLLRHAPPTVTVASLCLRTYDYSEVERTLESHGLVTERAAGTVRQRRFVGPQERAWAVSAVSEHGFDPTGHEDDGYYRAELFVSRPAEQVRHTPLSELVPSL